MSCVPDVKLCLYQGEDWTAELELSGDQAPTSLEGWSAFLEIRDSTKDRTLLVRRTTLTGEGITVSGEAALPTFIISIPKETTRLIPKGKHLIDCFLVPDTGDTFPPFSGTIDVTRRVTIEEVP